MTPRSTIRDVAARAGVSATTVSHVLSGQGRTSERTRDKVLAAVDELDYRPHPGARSLRSATYGAVGLLLPERATSFEFYSNLAMAAADAAFDHGVSLSLVPPTASASDIAGMPIDALVVADPVVGDLRLRRFRASGRPTAYCESVDDEPLSIDVGHEAVIADLLDHLVTQGCTRIAVLRPDLTVWWGVNVDRALRRWADGHPGVEVDVREMKFVASVDEVQAAVAAALATKPDALVGMQEGIGRLLVTAAEAHGYSVPEDLLVAVGVDSRDALLSPVPVTAIDLNARAGGRAAVDLVTGSAASQHPKARLQIRSSTQRVRPGSR